MSSEKLLVSILINNYNYESYLKNSIESALQQTYPNTEVIVIDDGSTDQSREIINSYKGRIIPIYKENGGIPSALNAGFEISQGDIICVLDSDDLWYPQKVEQVVHTFQKNPNTVLVYHRVQTITKAGITIGNPWPPYQIIRGDISHDVSQTGGWWPFPPSTALSYSRSYLDRVMKIPETQYRPLGADTYLADLAPFHGEIIGINQVLSLYRDHDCNHSKSWNQSFEDRMNYFKYRIDMLNFMFKEFNIPTRVRLKDHWPYQYFRFKSGREKNLFFLTQLILKNPWELRWKSKIKTMIQPLVRSLGYWLIQDLTAWIYS